jgi:type VI secretion system protein ImpF
VPELSPKERLQPSLLDRLTDEEPDRAQESRDKRVLSPQKLRESVRRDLSFLFNTTALSTVEDLERYPAVEHSTLNFGLPDLAGRTASSIDVPDVERALKRVILEFEPRLIKNSVKVKLVVAPEVMAHNTMSFAIEAELWAQPLPIRLYLRTELDLETGDVVVSDLGGG